MTRALYVFTDDDAAYILRRKLTELEQDDLAHVLSSKLTEEAVTAVLDMEQPGEGGRIKSRLRVLREMDARSTDKGGEDGVQAT